MTAQPSVSVIIPCYNREQYLGFAIQSVLAQTYTDFELIIVDDGSTDGSGEIARQFASQDSRIKLLTLIRPIKDKNRGAVNALITGFDAARGEFVCQVDSDDILECDALKLTIQALKENPEWGMVYTNYKEINANGKVVGIGHRCSIPYSKERILTQFMVFHFRLIRKSIYNTVGGFDPEIDLIEDYQLCLRLSEMTKIGKVNDFLYQYRNHDNTLRTNRGLDMILLSKTIIEQALVRRGLENTYRIKLEFNPKFSLIPILQAQD